MLDEIARDRQHDLPLATFHEMRELPGEMGFGACGKGASCALSSASAIRAPMSASARNSMVLIRRSKTSPNSAICSSL